MSHHQHTWMLYMFSVCDVFAIPCFLILIFLEMSMASSKCLLNISLRLYSHHVSSLTIPHLNIHLPGLCLCSDGYSAVHQQSSRCRRSLSITSLQSILSYCSNQHLKCWCAAVVAANNAIQRPHCVVHIAGRRRYSTYIRCAAFAAARDCRKSESPFRTT